MFDDYNYYFAMVLAQEMALAHKDQVGILNYYLKYFILQSKLFYVSFCSMIAWSYTIIILLNLKLYQYNGNFNYKRKF